MRVKNFDDLPDSMNDSWPWVCAIVAWDYHDATPLAKLISTETIPELLRHVVADIVGGGRPRKKKAAAKLKIPAAERMKVAAAVSLNLGLVNVLKSDVIDASWPGLKGAEMLSYRPGSVSGTTEGIRSHLNGIAADTVQKAADHFDVSVETIENLLRDLRKKINTWPNI